MWYPYTIIGIFLLILITMPKKLTFKEMYYSAGVFGFGTWLGDVLVGDVFKGFQIGPSPVTSPIDYIFVAFVPPAIGIIYVNFLTVTKSILYRWIFAVVSFLLEWGAVASGYMTSKGWHTWYSIPVYIFVFLIFFPLHLKIMRKD